MGIIIIFGFEEMVILRTWKKWLMFGTIITCVIAVAYIYTTSRMPKGIEVKSTPVKRGDMLSYLSAGGIIESRERRDYFAYTPSRIEKVYVEVGDRVGSDELLIKMEAPDLSLQLKQAYIQLEITETTLQNLKNKRDSVEKPILSEASDMSSYISAFQGIDDQIKLQGKQVEAALLNVNSIKDRINNAESEIKSDITGIVTSINGVNGGVAAVGIPMITVENTYSMKAVLNVSQYDAMKIKVGQEAQIKLGGGQKEYKGVVERINPTAKKTIIGIASETGIPVEISILNPDDDIRIGFDADVDITMDMRKNVLYVPYESVIKDKENHVRVFTMEQGRASLKDVIIGAESDFFVEIISGLNEGETVILNPPPQLKDGSLVDIWVSEE